MRNLDEMMRKWCVGGVMLKKEKGREELEEKDPFRLSQ
jgi:hypothetical protein